MATIAASPLFERVLPFYLEAMKQCCETCRAVAEAAEARREETS